MRRVLIDSGPLAALFDADDRWHVRTLSFLRAYRGELLCSAANVTEAVTIDEQDFAFYRLRNGRCLVKLLTQTRQSQGQALSADCRLTTRQPRATIRQVASSPAPQPFWR